MFELVLGGLFGSLAVSVIDLARDVFYAKGSTEDKDKLIKSFLYFCSKYKSPTLVLHLNRIGAEVICVQYDITKENKNEIINALRTQDWKEFMGVGYYNKIDFDKVKKIKGDYTGSYAFNIYYCGRDK